MLLSFFTLNPQYYLPPTIIESHASFCAVHRSSSMIIVTLALLEIGRGKKKKKKLDQGCNVHEFAPLEIDNLQHNIMYDWAFFRASESGLIILCCQIHIIDYRT